VWAILRKELSTLLYSLIAYLVWGIFLVGTGLFLWVFSGSVIQTGAAEMDNFFSVAPWFLLFFGAGAHDADFSGGVSVGDL
jgi:ABC-2 type transport system permease protein